ncbi:lethal(3)malignant brain tumor-like protein 1 isoform X2 [Drosophila montana]|uniref:lethal(3)malignant brain tumor-like protein 1 isoform X2 n=1 Tax=Drosophila montana TaxID=40370 RepID=UPI00313ABBCC
MSQLYLAVLKRLKVTSTVSASSAAAQISLLSKSRTPVILSKAAVEKIRLKFGQVQAQVNAGALFLTKSLKTSAINTNNTNNKSGNSRPAPETAGATQPAVQKPSGVVATSMPTPMPAPMPTPMPAPMPTPMPLPMPMPSNALPEIKISPLPAVALNGAKIMKVQASPLAVIMPTVPAPVQAPTATTTMMQPSVQQGSPKLQRSKSLAGNEENAAVVLIQSNATERRHSVAIMAKEVDVVEQSKPIETITIDDDDSEEEKEAQQNQQQAKRQQLAQKMQQQKPQQQQQQQQKTPTTSTQTSRKNSTASRSSITSSSSSDVEMIIVPEEVRPKQLETKQPANGAIINIVKAETLSLSKEEFEKSLRCDEHVDNSSPSSVCTNHTSKSGTITLTPISRLQHNGVEPKTAAAVALNTFKRSMQQHFGMLRWREKQPGMLQNSTMRFELNRYNLLQLAERCDSRQGPASYFERALFDRPVRRPNSTTHPLLYLCSRCNCHGPASDFLAPRFCSFSCVRRAHKRRQLNPPSAASESKISRMQEPKVVNGHLQQQNQLQQQQMQLQQQLQREQERERERERKSTAAKRPFRWTEYLKLKTNGDAAPIHLFLNPFPIKPNCFKRGMKLEAIDPENCSLFCVCTIVEVRGYRLKLNFDGYSSMYDFWVNADSMDIFPPGWCERTSHVLQAPKGYCPDRFTWYRYLVKTKAKAAPSTLFTHLNATKHTQKNNFSVGMHLEAEDLNDTGKICVATVADILDERIRVHFDGWDDCYDFWVHINSPYIHPCGWHEGRQQLIVPPDYQNLLFNWADYIEEVGGIAAPADLFKPREPMEFQARMKLEVVDQRNPCLIRPATVVTRKGYRIQLHLDCWPAEYYFWLEDDSPDLHPIGWCEATSHELEVPPGFQQRASLMPCDVAGCRGFGNAKRFNLNVHALRDCCPYAPENWRQWRAKTVKPPRVLPEHIKRTESPKPLPQPQPQPQPIKIPSPIFESQLNTNPKPALVNVKTYVKAKKSRPSLDCEPKPKLKREEPKPLSIEIKPEPVLKSAEDEPMDLNPHCLSIAKTIVAEYGPQFARNYRLWQKNSDFDMAQLKSNPLYWTNWDVYEFVERALKSSSIAQLLFDEEIDGRALLMMGRKDLATYFKLKVGPTVKLFSLIVNLRIAVACKFDTKETGLNFNRVRCSTLPSKQEPVENKPELKTDNHLTATPNGLEQAELVDSSAEQDNLEEEREEEADENDVDDDYSEHPERELTDEEDVVLDSEDFLSVKPIHSIVNNVRTIDDTDSDVIMTPHDVLPVTVS